MDKLPRSSAGTSIVSSRASYMTIVHAIDTVFPPVLCLPLRPPLYIDPVGYAFQSMSWRRHLQLKLLRNASRHSLLCRWVRGRTLRNVNTRYHPNLAGNVSAHTLHSCTASIFFSYVANRQTDVNFSDTYKYLKYTMQDVCPEPLCR